MTTGTWCAPCKRAKPFYNALADRYGMVKFYLVDVDNFDGDNKFSDKIKGLTKVPSLLFYLNGEIVGEMTGWDLNKVVANIENKILADEEEEDHDDIRDILSNPISSKTSNSRIKDMSRGSDIIEETPPIGSDGEECDEDISKYVNLVI